MKVRDVLVHRHPCDPTVGPALERAFSRARLLWPLGSCGSPDPFYLLCAAFLILYPGIRRVPECLPVGPSQAGPVEQDSAHVKRAATGLGDPPGTLDRPAPFSGPGLPVLEPRF